MSSTRLEKRVPERNQFRFYRLDLQPTLFGQWSFIREWGRIGQEGRVVISTFPTAAEADSAMQRKHRQKERRGYCTLGAAPHVPRTAVASIWQDRV